MNRKIRTLIAALPLLVMACSAVPETLGSRGIERIAQIPPESRKRIDESLGKHFQIVEDGEIHDYLTNIARRLFSAVESAGPSLRVQAVSFSGARAVPQTWMIPPTHGYVDERILKAMNFENEIAAGVAFEWERTQDIAFEKRFIAELDSPAPDYRKIYEFSEVEDLKAVEGAVDRMYRAGYDPRGLVTYFERMSSFAKGRTATAFESRIPLLQEKARRTIAFYAPLLNPIVRTEDFYKIRKKLERL